jgi:hypothetical protein
VIDKAREPSYDQEKQFSLEAKASAVESRASYGNEVTVHRLLSRSKFIENLNLGGDIWSRLYLVNHLSEGSYRLEARRNPGNGAPSGHASKPINSYMSLDSS